MDSILKFILQFGIFVFDFLLVKVLYGLNYIKIRAKAINIIQYYIEIL